MALFNFSSASRPIALPGGELLLRSPEAGDFVAWKNIREESRDFLVPWEPRWPEDDLTRRGYRRRLKRYHLERELRVGETYFLVRASDNGPIGGISVSNIRRGAASTCTIGYWMGQSHAGKGHMREALGAIANHIFCNLRLSRIEAACLPDNKRSTRLLEGSGFTREGLLRKYLEINGTRRDHLLFSRLIDDHEI